MKDDDWEKAKEIFAEAIKVAPDERESFLDRVCQNDSDIRREIESLLAAHDDANSFMEQPAIGKIAEPAPGNSFFETGRKFGHYEIIKQIGTGGMGVVYLANDKTLDRRVAIKILNEQFAEHETNLNRFTREAKAASALNHPNILVIHEIGEAENMRYIVSEFVDGKTLREISGAVPLKLPEVLDIAVQVAGALSAAHTAKIIHRDIKPENIMVRPDGFVKILDFGLAKLLEQKFFGHEESTVKQDRTAEGIILGTVKYMSPEQAKGEQVDERTDIFSFGTVLYEMLAGRTPFEGKRMSETFANLINDEPQPVSRYAANVPDEMERIISKTLRKNKDERYQTCKDLLNDLRNLQKDLTFDERLGKSQPPNADNATAVLPLVTGNVKQQTIETEKSFSQIVRRRKSLIMLALAVSIIGAIGLGYYFLAPKNPNPYAGSKKSLAVLPFVNAGNDPNAEYLSDGITESIINNLSQLSSLRVMSRNSAFRFKNNQTDVKTISSQLGVENLVTGDIKQFGDKFVINVRLINASDDSQIWGNQYVKSSADLIVAQTEIAQAVADNLRVKLTNAEQKQIAKRPTENVEAYQFYLQGLYHWNKLTPPEIDRSIEYFQHSVDVDPNFSLAYAVMGRAYFSLSLTSDAPSQEVFPKARAATLSALRIDDTLAEAHTMLGWIKFWFDWDWKGAEKEIQRALELNPNLAEASIAYANMLTFLGRHEEAIAMAQHARELDPLNLRINALEGQALFYAGKYDDSLIKLQRTIELEPNFWMSHLFLSRVYIEKKMYAEAIEEATKARTFSNGNSESVAHLIYALAKSGKRDKAQTELENLKTQSAARYVPPYSIALSYNGLGETDEAISWLEKGFQQRDVRMPFLKVEPKWNNLNSDSRYQNLLRRVGFQQ